MVRAESEARLRARADQFRRRAAILRNDAAMFLDAPAVTATPVNRQPLPYWARARNDRRVDVISKDAEYQSTEYSNLHWGLAMDMLDAVRAPRDPFVAQWFAIIGAYLVDQRRYSDGWRTSNARAVWCPMILASCSPRHGCMKRWQRR